MVYLWGRDDGVLVHLIQPRSESRHVFASPDLPFFHLAILLLARAPVTRIMRRVHVDRRRDRTIQFGVRCHGLRRGVAVLVRGLWLLGRRHAYSHMHDADIP